MSYLPDIHRALPQAPDAEQGVLASLCLSPKEVLVMCSERNLTAEWFHAPSNGEIFKVISDLIRDGKPVEFITIAQTLQDLNKLEVVGGPAAISNLFTFLPTAANAAHYMEMMRDKHQLRSIIAVCTEYASRAYEEQKDVPALLAQCHADITGLVHTRSKRETIKESIKQILQEIITGQPDGTLLATGMEGVDGRLALYRGDLLIVSAPTSCGKSALSFNIAMNVAMRGKRVGVYPLEMRQKQSLKRSIAQLSGYNAEFVRKLAQQAATGTESQKASAKKAQEEFCAAAQTILAMKLHMRDDLTRLEGIIADIRAESAREKFDFIVIDYLQLIQTGQRFERRQLEVAHITKSLKALANEMDCVICAPSQVNNDGGTREAADAENDASALIKIHADKNDSGDVQPGRVEVWKQREGARHIDLPLTFNGLLTRFEYRAK